jgi:hypothetical protein
MPMGKEEEPAARFHFLFSFSLGFSRGPCRRQGYRRKKRGTQNDGRTVEKIDQEVPMNNIDKVLKLLEKHFPLARWKQEMKDTRRRPHISPGTIAQAIVEMVARGQKSLLEMDGDARLPEIKAWHGSEREMVVSDSTAFRALAGFDLKGIHAVLWEMATRMSDGAMLVTELPSGRKARIGAVDGSQWGDFTASVLTLVGAQTDLVAGYRMGRGRGHELTTTRGLLKEAVEHLGRSFVDYVAVDGLYMTQDDFRWCVEEVGSHLVVKTDEETLTVVEDARGLFFGNNEEVVDGLETAEGFDAERMAEYRVTAAKGFKWQGVRLKVAHVWERYLNTKKGHPEEVEFWVFTTDETLSAEDMREVAHLRWHIENRTFRQLNHLVRSKRRVSKDAHVKEALLGLWFIGLNLFGIFLRWIRMGSLGASFKAVKKTWKWFCKMFNRATLVAYMEST